MTVPPRQSDPEADAGLRMHRLIGRLYPIPRSITGNGVRRTLEALNELLPLKIHEIPSGSPLYDWEVPPEWNWSEAYIEDPSGVRVVDAAEHNLHLIGYSVPVDQTMSLDELKPHLHTLPDRPDWIPYRTSYYKRTWGFCLAHNRLKELKPGLYRVRIRSTLEPGSLTYGECILPGNSGKEILISSHVCHPALANDNLSSIAVALELGRYLAALPRRYTWRILFAPGTIGALAWLKDNEPNLDRLAGGLVLACMGDAGQSTYKRSRIGDALIDRAMEQALADSGKPYALEDFAPTGYDQRQYGSPGFNLPVGSLMRTPNGRFPEYHTSADNLDLVRPDALADSLDKLIAAAKILETIRTYLNLQPRGELQLGKRGLYTTGAALDALLWTLNLSDGEHDLLSIARRSKLPYALIAEAAAKLAEKGVLGDHPPR